jgi:hypothetical protein
MADMLAGLKLPIPLVMDNPCDAAAFSRCRSCSTQLQGGSRTQHNSRTDTKAGACCFGVVFVSLDSCGHCNSRALCACCCSGRIVIGMLLLFVVTPRIVVVSAVAHTVCACCYHVKLCACCCCLLLFRTC